MKGRFQGVLKIARYNWPWYAVALAANALAALLAYRFANSIQVKTAIFAALAIGDFWLLGSLIVSFYVYDRSPISRGGWLHGVTPQSIHHAAVLHAGEDEASAALASRFPSARLSILDFFDPAKNAAPSLARARALAQFDPRVTRISSDRIPLADGQLDLACVIFAAHEIRNDEDRAAFFRELRRTLGPRGRVIVVEHLRDGWNALAYGPGVFHFLSRVDWLQTFAASGLILEREARCTPFVSIFDLRNPL